MSSNGVSGETSTETRAISAWTQVALSSLSSQPAKLPPPALGRPG
jgi:hypothetical protein